MSGDVMRTPPSSKKLPMAKRVTRKSKAAKISPFHRAAQVAEMLLAAVEIEMQREGSAEEKQERLFGSKGLLTHLPKLIQLLDRLDRPMSEETAEEPMSRADMKLLKEWLAQGAD